MYRTDIPWLLDQTWQEEIKAANLGKYDWVVEAGEGDEKWGAEEVLRREWDEMCIRDREYQEEIQEGQKGAGSMMEQYCTDMTARAEEGKLDPVLGREQEMYRLMQILSRRTNNNPCLCLLYTSRCV